MLQTGVAGRVVASDNMLNQLPNLSTASQCNTLQYTATHCNTLQHTATRCRTSHGAKQHHTSLCVSSNTESKHYNTLQHTATHCNTLQHTATHCNTLQVESQSCDYCNSGPHYSAGTFFALNLGPGATGMFYRYSLQHTATHCNTLQHTATHRNTPQIHTSTDTHTHTPTHTHAHTHIHIHTKPYNLNPDTFFALALSSGGAGIF